jgi:hypothetical protein
MSPAEFDAKEFPQSRGGRDATDSQQADLGFGEGGVPWYLLLFYLAFLTFFVWYSLEYQLPDFLDRSDLPVETPADTPAE